METNGNEAEFSEDLCKAESELNYAAISAKLAGIKVRVTVKETSDQNENHLNYIDKIQAVLSEKCSTHKPSAARSIDSVGLIIKAALLEARNIIEKN